MVSKLQLTILREMGRSRYQYLRSSTMLTVLSEAERMLPELLKTRKWNSLLVDYHPPFVERLWCQWLDFRICLHRIRACDEGAALFHPHPWPSAMRVVAGRYEMGVGYTAGDTAPPVAAKLIMPAGTAYEMTEPDGWHYVRPLTDVTLSVMVSGKPWSRRCPKNTKQLRPLAQHVVAELLEVFRCHYS